MSYWKSEYFKTLQKAWYQLLSDNGFKDAEKPVGDRMELKQSAEYPYRHSRSQVEREKKEAYYAKISQCIADCDFDDQVDEIVLCLYADGKRIKEICLFLESIDEGRCRETVRFIIRRYEMKWGIKNYTMRQLNRKK